VRTAATTTTDGDTDDGDDGDAGASANPPGESPPADCAAREGIPVDCANGDADELACAAPGAAACTGDAAADAWALLPCAVNPDRLLESPATAAAAAAAAATAAAAHAALVGVPPVEATRGVPAALDRTLPSCAYRRLACHGGTTTWDTLRRCSARAEAVSDGEGELVTSCPVGNSAPAPSSTGTMSTSNTPPGGEALGALWASTAASGDDDAGGVDDGKAAACACEGAPCDEKHEERLRRLEATTA
jgi:hypothetical protein